MKNYPGAWTIELSYNVQQAPVPVKAPLALASPNSGRVKSFVPFMYLTFICIA